MIVMGVDPGPSDFAWAMCRLYDDAKVKVYDWGSVVLPPVTDAELVRMTIARETPTAFRGGLGLVAIEGIVLPVEGIRRGLDLKTKPLIETAYMVGMLLYVLGQRYGCPVVVVPRPRVKAALPGCSVTSGDPQVNAAMKTLCPNLAKHGHGLNSHTRAAAALAYVAGGIWKAEQITTGVKV